MFETRFITWGISRWTLFLFGVLPLAILILHHGLSLMWFFPALILVVLWIFSISRGHYQMLQVYGGAWMVLLTVELILALRDKDLVQMLIGMAGVAISLVLYHRIERQMGLAFNGPLIQWYEGVPKIFPRVRLRIFLGDQWVQGNLRRMDDHGLFLILDPKEMNQEILGRFSQSKKTLFQLELGYRDQEFSGKAKLRSLFVDRTLGLGLQIVPKDLYHFTQYSKIVRTLKGEGYAT